MNNANNGKNDKGVREQKKQPKLTLKEKRKLKNEKKILKSPVSGTL